MKMPFCILSPWSRKRRKNPSAQIPQLREGNGFLLGRGLPLYFKTPSAVPQSVSRVDRGTATTLQMYPPPQGLRALSRGAGEFFLPSWVHVANFTLQRHICKVSSGTHDFPLSEAAGEHQAWRAGYVWNILLLLYILCFPKSELNLKCRGLNNSVQERKITQWGVRTEFNPQSY